MKKYVTVAAALAVGTLASAQSSVTMYGVVDGGVSYYDAKSTNVTTGAVVKNSQFAQTSGQNIGSQLGFRGTEDLGGGLAAGFWLESLLFSDSGAAGVGGALFNRRSTVSLSGPFGEVRLGRDYTATFWNDAIFDPFGTVGSGYNLIGSTHLAPNVIGGRLYGAGVNPATNVAAANNSYLDPNYARASNMVGYFLPASLGGVYGQVQYSLSENVKTTGSDLNQAGRYIGGRIGYAKGPLNVAGAYGESTLFDNGAGVSTTAKTTNLGASYDFGVVKAMGELSQVKNVFANAGFATNEISRRGALIGLTMPVGVGQIRASYAMTRDSGSLVSNYSSSTPKSSQLALGYVHNLSKRTALYATVTHIGNQNGAASNMTYTAGTNVRPLATYAGTTPGSANGYTVGMRHTF